jgi:hypothetical protein
MESIRTLFFSSDSTTEVGYSKRLRAVVQKHFSDFADNMHKKWLDEVDSRAMACSTREYLKIRLHVGSKELMDKSRGRELLGMLPLTPSEPPTTTSPSRMSCS